MFHLETERFKTLPRQIGDRLSNFYKSLFEKNDTADPETLIDPNTESYHPLKAPPEQTSAFLYQRIDGRSEKRMIIGFLPNFDDPKPVDVEKLLAEINELAEDPGVQRLRRRLRR